MTYRTGRAWALLAAGVTSAAAQVTSVNGQIAYTVCSAGASGICDVWTANGDGSGARNLTNTPMVSEIQPVWSPDGARLAFVRDNGAGDSKIWTMNADGTSAAILPGQTSRQLTPAWSPGGTQIAFAREMPGVAVGFQLDLFVTNLDGTGQLNITRSDGNELEPAWSPDGTKLAYAAVRQANGILDLEVAVANPNGTGEKIVSVTGVADRRPSWSPDSQRVIYMSQAAGPWQIRVAGQDGSGRADVLSSAFNDQQPSWSPDGSLVTFASERSGAGTFDLFTVTSFPRGVRCGHNCSEPLPAFSTITLTASPANGSAFTGWAGACEGQTGEACTVAMNDVKLVEARFTSAR